MFTSIGEILCHGSNLLIFMIILPVICSILLLISRKHGGLSTGISYVFAALNLLFSISLYSYGEFFMEIPYTSYGFEFILRNYSLSALFLLLTAVVCLLIVIYLGTAKPHMKRDSHKQWYLFYIFLSLTMANGTLLSDDLGIMLFFAEGLLAVIFGILLLGNMENPNTSFKALGTLGVAILTFMFGIVLTVHMAHTGLMSKIDPLIAEGENVTGFLCIMTGALGLAGLMPFHGWTVDSAEVAPTVFIAAFPGSLLKILGVYIAARVLDIYKLIPESKISMVLIILGVLSFVFGGAMALVQKNTGRLMAYTSTSLLGIIVLCMVNGVSSGVLLIILVVSVLLNMVCLLITGKKQPDSEIISWDGADNIRNAPVLKKIYNAAEKGWLDPYNWLMAFIGVFSDICTSIEHGISWVYDKGIPGLVNRAGKILQNFNTGNLTRYLTLVVTGVALIVVIFLVTLL